MKDKKILVVDFDEASLISLSNLVFEEGFQAVTALDGLSGYEKFKAEEFDLALIEPMLPKLHGFELMKRINQDSQRKIPIIVVTGIYREPSCKREALQVYGASAYFTKPWNKEDLRAKILKLLSNGAEEPAEKEEDAAPARAKSPAPPAGDDWGLLKTSAAPKQEKASKPLDDLEQELQAAVSGLTGTSHKKEKESVKGAGKEKTEAKASVEGDIEALLKGAIGGLGLDQKKKKRNETARPEVKPPQQPPKPQVEPEAKPVPSVETKPEADRVKKTEKIPVAKDIKERIPPQPRIANNVPPAPARPPAPVIPEKPSHGIDRTLIEIDKIPLDMEKEPAEPEKSSIETRTSRPEIKRAYFDDYSEPARKKPPVAVIGGLAAAVLIIAGSTFIALKSKKPKDPAHQMVSSLQPSLPSEFAQRQEEIQAAPTAKENVARPARKTQSNPPPKKTVIEPAIKPSATESSVPIAPVFPEETPPLGLELQADPSIDSASQTFGDSASRADISGQRDVSPQTETPPAKPQANEPTAILAKPGDLVALANVDVAPVLLKKVDPKYPVQALNMGVGGTVTVNALISETGEVIRTEILKGIKGGYGLERAAETAIRQWQFKAAEKDGAPVRVWKQLDIVFKTNPSQNQ